MESPENNSDERFEAFPVDSFLNSKEFLKLNEISPSIIWMVFSKSNGFELSMESSSSNTSVPSAFNEYFLFEDDNVFEHEAEEENVDSTGIVSELFSGGMDSTDESDGGFDNDDPRVRPTDNTLFDFSSSPISDMKFVSTDWRLYTSVSLVHTDFSDGGLDMDGGVTWW